MNQSERRRYLIQELLDEHKEYDHFSIPEDTQGQKDLLRGLLNVRAPKMLSREFLKIQDEYLQEETAKKGIVELDSLTPVETGIYLWQGDITTLRCDAIVNAANSGMTGCYAPNHFPKERAAQIAVHTVREFWQQESRTALAFWISFASVRRISYSENPGIPIFTCGLRYCI